MIDNVENLGLEMLKALRNDVKSQGVKMDEQFESLCLRLSSMENHLAGLRREVAGLHADVAIIHGRMDKFETHLDRIERRLDLRDETFNPVGYGHQPPSISMPFNSLNAGAFLFGYILRSNRTFWWSAFFIAFQVRQVRYQP